MDDGEMSTDEKDVVVRKRGRKLTIGRAGLAIVLSVLGFVLLSGVVWRWFVSTPLAEKKAARLAADYRSSCAKLDVTTPSTPPLVPQPKVIPVQGTVIGEISIPKLGLDGWPIVAGVSDDSLSGGVGWYQHTALPGEVGNFALAGRRIADGAPFRDFLRLSVGDQVIVTTCRAVYVYVIDVSPTEVTVRSDASWVLDALPGSPGEYPGAALVTLTANQDLLPTRDRSIAFGHLVEKRPRS